MSEQILEILKDNFIQTREIQKGIDELKSKEGDSQTLDKLKTILDNQQTLIQEFKATKNKGGDTQTVEELKRLIVRQTSEIEELKNKKLVIDASKFLDSKPTKYITILGGNNAFVTYKWALGIIAFVLCFWIGSKYIPIYLNESKALEDETVRNSKFVTFLRLKQFKEHGETSDIDSFLNKVNSSDSTFVNDYNSLLGHYNKEKERVSTEKAIKELQNKLEDTKK